MDMSGQLGGWQVGRVGREGDGSASGVENEALAGCCFERSCLYMVNPYLE
jgi:hypothetical protein